MDLRLGQHAQVTPARQGFEPFVAVVLLSNMSVKATVSQSLGRTASG